jgi:uncharacterized Tic20 family protein
MRAIPSTQERVWAALAHLSALAMGMGLVLPVIGWSEQRRGSRYVSFQALQALGYQSLGYTLWLLTAMVFVVIGMFGLLAGLGTMEDPASQLTGWLIGHFGFSLALFGFYYALPVIGAIACAFGRDFRYPFMGHRLARYLGYDDPAAEWLDEDHADRWVVAMGHFSVIIMLWGLLPPLVALILQGKRTFFMRFQSIQTLVFQGCTTLLFLAAIAFYFAGLGLFVGVIGIAGELDFNTPAALAGLIVLFISLLVMVGILLVVPLLHITGQWAGYRVLKGEDYRYPLIGKWIEKRLTR